MRFGRKEVLRGVSFDMSSGECVTLAGPNGAGKSTVLKCVLGLLDYEGSILLDGIDIKKLGSRSRERMAYVPQTPVFPKMTARQVLKFFSRLRGMDVARANEILEIVGLTDDADRPAQDFSGGMKQRLSLGVAMIGEPDLYMLDEPTANLDSKGRLEIMKVLVDLRDDGKSFLISTHDTSNAGFRSDRIITIIDGIVDSDVGVPD